MKELIIKNKIIDEELNRYQLERFKQYQNNDQTNYLRKPINPATALYFYNNSNAVANAIDILAEDVILTNYINLESETHNVEDLEFYLNNSYFKIEYANVYKDYELFGAGCGVLTPSLENDMFFDIFHIPQPMVSLKKVNFEGKLYIIACQYKSGLGNEAEFNYFKLDNNYYPADFKSYGENTLNTLHWLGSGQFYGHYNVPWITQIIDEASSQLALKKLNYKSFSTGNNSNGIVYFNQVGVKKMDVNLPAAQREALKKEVREDQADFNASVIRSSVDKAGDSNALIYHESEEPMKIDYIAFNNDNYKYLEKKDENYENAILKRARIPSERLMSSNGNESINSQKTKAIWEIYVNNINARQTLPEMRLKDLTQTLYGMTDMRVGFEVPLFADIIQTKIDYITKLFDKGMLTLRTAIKLISPYLDWRIDVEDIDDEYLDRIYYNGIAFDYSTAVGDLSLDEMQPPLHITNENPLQKILSKQS